MIAICMTMSRLLLQSCKLNWILQKCKSMVCIWLLGIWTALLLLVWSLSDLHVFVFITSPQQRSAYLTKLKLFFCKLCWFVVLASLYKHWLNLLHQCRHCTGRQYKSWKTLWSLGAPWFWWSCTMECSLWTPLCTLETKETSWQLYNSLLLTPSICSKNTKRLT